MITQLEFGESDQSREGSIESSLSEMGFTVRPNFFLKSAFAIELALSCNL